VDFASMTGYRLTDASQPEFVAWLSRCPEDRMFGNFNNDCPLACFLLEAHQQTEARVGMFVCFPSGLRSDDSYELPDWCMVFVRKFGYLLPQSCSAQYALIYAKISHAAKS